MQLVAPVFHAEVPLRCFLDKPIGERPGGVGPRADVVVPDNNLQLGLFHQREATAMDVIYRYGLVSDADAMAAYHHQCVVQAYVPRIDGLTEELLDPQRWVTRFAEWISNPDLATVVATVEGVAVGHSCVAVGGEHAGHVHHLFVSPARQRQGIGQELLAVGERLLRRAGCEAIELHTVVGNAPAIALYTSNGWELTDRLVEEDSPAGPYNEHVLVKDLTTGHVGANRSHWDESAPDWLERGRRSWASAPHWGEMMVQESDLVAAGAGVLPELQGRDVVEFGCGTGYVSSWCLAAGASVAVGLDNSGAQLRSARLLQGEFDRPFPLIHGNAEQVPFRDDSFDVVINEYGAAIWCDPYHWIPEAARVLRSGGDLVFLASTPLLMTCAPDFEWGQTSEQLLRPMRDMHEMRWPDFDGVEFHVPHGDMIRLLRRCGFEVMDLIELYPPPGAPERFSFYDRDWAERYPAEEVWVARFSG